MPVPVATQSNLSILTQRRDAAHKRTQADVRLHAMPPSDAAQAKSVLFEALSADPTHRWCFFGGEQDFDKRLRAYLDVGHRWHCAQGHPIYAAYQGGYLIGAAYLALPEPQIPVDFEPFELDLMRGCGEESVERFAHYNRAVAAAWPVGRMYALSLLGVRRTYQRRGIGTRLVHWANGVCDGDNGAAGLIVDAASGATARVFARAGYREIAQTAVNPDLRQSVLFRPRLDLVA
jgi:GNAT superfamily N-acetyltransferase